MNLTPLLLRTSEASSAKSKPFPRQICPIVHKIIFPSDFISKIRSLKLPKDSKACCRIIVGEEIFSIIETLSAQFGKKCFKESTQVSEIVNI